MDTGRAPDSLSRRVRPRCCSPDLNPIEQLFARLKSFLRKMKSRTVEQLWRAIASFLKGVSKEECNAYLANSGYT
jgi:transposase